MLHQPLGLQMKLSHHIYELRREFEEDSTYFTFNNLPSILFIKLIMIWWLLWGEQQ